MKSRKQSKTRKATERLFSVTGRAAGRPLFGVVIRAMKREEARAQIYRVLRKVRLTVRPVSLEELLSVTDIRYPSGGNGSARS